MRKQTYPAKIGKKPKKFRKTLWILLCSGCFMLALPTVPVKAQADPDEELPKVYLVDNNGVDLISATLKVSEEPLSIGANDHRGLSFNRQYDGKNWKLNLENEITTKTKDGDTTWTAELQFENYVFYEVSSGVYGPKSHRGSTLSYDGVNNIYTLTTSDGSVVQYSRNMADLSGFPSTGFFTDSRGKLTSVKYPDGLQINYHYKSTTLCMPPSGGGSCQNKHFARLQSVTTNTGYQMKLKYRQDAVATYSDLGTWRHVQQVSSINNASEYCNPLADSCPLSLSWPSIIYENSTTIGTPPSDRTYTETVTSSTGRVTIYTHTIEYLESVVSYGLRAITAIAYPGLPAETVTIVPNSTYQRKVATLTKGGNAWQYDFDNHPSTLKMEVNVTTPLSSSLNVISDFDPSGDMSDQVMTDALGRVTRYDYDSNGFHIEKITFPDGKYTQYDYDSRDNLVYITDVPRPGSNVASKVVRYSYDPSCSNRVICNRPNFKIDARGFQTDFTYDPVHGGLLTSTEPAVGSIRPQTRYTYAQRYAWFKDGSGSYVRANSPIWVLVQESFCKTGAASGDGCAVAGDEVRTIYDHGPDSGPNNLLLRGKVIEADGQMLRTCYAYDVKGNKISETQPQAGLANCP